MRWLVRSAMRSAARPIRPAAQAPSSGARCFGKEVGGIQDDFAAALLQESPALPLAEDPARGERIHLRDLGKIFMGDVELHAARTAASELPAQSPQSPEQAYLGAGSERSEERRVGKECRSR